MVTEFRNTSSGAKRVVVRDFRVPCSIATELIDAVKEKLKNQGYQVAMVADYEIEGRIKTSTDYQGIQRDVLKLKIINPSGFDRTQQFSITPGLVEVSCNAGKEADSKVNGSKSDRIKIPETKPNSSRHQIYPDEEWKIYEVSPNVMRHTRNGFVNNRGDWQTFWAICKMDIGIPTVDFQKQIVRVETVPSPQ